MSSQIEVARVQQYSANVFLLAQQKGSRIRAAVRNESVVGKSAFFDRIGAVSAVKKSGRHSPTPQLDTPHSRRMVAMYDYEWADLIDNEDKLKMLHDPASEYAMSAMFALGRSMDTEILNAALGNAMTGEAGASTQILSTSQRLAPLTSYAGAGAHTNLDVHSLIQAKRILDASDVDPMIPRFCAINASALASLLNSTQVTSADYNTVKALVQGELDTFLGFKFIRTELVPATSVAFKFNATTGLYDGAGTSVSLASGINSMVCWAQDGLLLGLGQDVKARVSERDDLSYSNQVYASMSIGAVRMEEAKVVEIVCSQ